MFSEGIQLETQSHVIDKFQGLIALANQVGVSVYTVDAAGLRAGSPLAASRAQARAAAADESRHGSAGADHVLFHEPHTALSRLATETGGAFTRDTNDLGTAADRLREDLASYYLLGYVPTNSVRNRGFRHIVVRVRRPDVTVQAREGYEASDNAQQPTR